MTDTTLQNTLATGSTTLPAQQPASASMPKALTTPEATGNTQTDIRNLKGAVQKPSTMMDFQAALRAATQSAYNIRQEADMKRATSMADPTKVSGGMFSRIIGQLEASRGGDASKIYASTTQGFQLAQQRATDRLEFLEQLEESRRQFEAEMKIKKAELKILKKDSEQKYKIKKDQFDMDKKSWELSYQKALNNQEQKDGITFYYPNMNVYRSSWDSSSTSNNNNQPAQNEGVLNYDTVRDPNKNVG